jgi:hypothetical protein
MFSPQIKYYQANNQLWGESQTWVEGQDSSNFTVTAMGRTYRKSSVSERN